MTFTYTPSATPTDVTLVRYYTRDTESTSAMWSDEEINMIIGQKGSNINKIQAQLQKGLEKLIPNFKKMKLNINLKIKDTAPETSAQIINSQINDALVAKKDYKKVVRSLAKLAQEKGALGMRTRVKGRINGKAIASSTQLKFGSVPLHTLSVKVQKHVRHVYTKSGRIGITTILALAGN